MTCKNQVHCKHFTEHRDQFWIEADDTGSIEWRDIGAGATGVTVDVYAIGFVK